MADLYVADFGDHVVKVYYPASSVLFFTITGLNQPQAMAFDSSGNLYVADLSGGVVYKFAAQPNSTDQPVVATTPTGTLTGVASPWALAFDSSGNLYVASGLPGNGVSPVTVFKPGATFPYLALSGPPEADALAFDGSGNLYVTDISDNTISVYGPGASIASATISGLNGPESLAFDNRDNLFVANAGSNSVSVFRPGSATPIATIPGLNTPNSLAFDSSGNLYVATQASVSVFGPALEAGGVVIRAGDSDLPINIGSGFLSSTGLTVTSAELARIFTTTVGTLTFGDSNQTGEISLGDVSPAVPNTDIVTVQSPTGPGAINLIFAVNQPAIANGNGDIHLTAGTGGIVVNDGPLGSPALATTGNVTLDSFGGIGNSVDAVAFDVADTPAGVTVGASFASTIGVYLAGIGALTLDNVYTANAPVVVTADFNLTVVPNAIVDSGAGILSLSAAAAVFGSTTVPDGVLTISAGVVLVSSNSSADAITLLGSDIEIDTGVAPATIGLSHTVGQPPTPVAGGVVFGIADADIPISVGTATGNGLFISNAELARVFTTATGTITFGGSGFSGNIIFAGATPATTPGASVARDAVS